MANHIWHTYMDPMGSIIDKGFSPLCYSVGSPCATAASGYHTPSESLPTWPASVDTFWAMHQVHVDAKILWPVLETPGCRNTIKNNTRVDDLVKRKITYESPISMGHFLRNQQGKQPQAAKVASSYGPQWLRCAVPGTFWVVLRLGGYWWYRC